MPEADWKKKGEWGDWDGMGGEQEEGRFLAVGDEEDAELAPGAEPDCPHVPFEIVKRTELGQMAVREGLGFRVQGSQMEKIRPHLCRTLTQL